MKRSRAETRLAVLLVAITGALWLPSAAQAFDVPRCSHTQTYARPGLDRSFEMHCSFTDAIDLVQAPQHGQLSDLEIDSYGKLTWRYRADDDAPAEDRFTVELTGPAGSLEHEVAIHVIPRDVNTAPTCEPVRHAQRTDGAGPATLEFHVWCRDDEADELTIDGGGPGQHLSTPIAVSGGMGGGGVPWMHYRTAVASGTEQATFWATDVLGARSAETPIDLTFGPSVDRLPACRPNPTLGGFDAFPVYSRPGAVRRFGIRCEDPDGDPFEPRVAQPPSRGAFTGFAVDQQRNGYWGTERWIDATYAPNRVFEGDDPFSVVAEGPPGAAATPMVIRTRALPDNNGASCGWSPAQSWEGAPTVVEIGCDDHDGDPLQAAVTEGPLHGIAAPPVITTETYGQQKVRIGYTPAPGFFGVDIVEVTVSDGHDPGYPIPVEIRIDRNGWGAPPPPLRPPPGVPRPAPLPQPAPTIPRVTDAPVAGQRPAVAPREQARQLLGRSSLRLVRRVGSARLYAAVGAREDLLALTCALDCRARVERRLRHSQARARASRGPRLATRRLVAGPSQGARIDLRLSRAERAAARRAGRRRLSVRVVVTDAAGAQGAARLRVPVR